MNPLVSIIIPVYNTSKYLDECLSSLTNQTLHNIEIVCVNDASTDNSLEVLEKWASVDKRIVVINSPVNKKQGGARNLGIGVSKGQYIGFVDSDDFVDVDMYKILYEATEEGLHDVAVSRCYYKHGKSDRKMSNFPVNFHYESHEELLRYIALHGCRLVTSIFKSTIIKENHIRFPENMFYEDNATGFFFYGFSKSIKIVESKPLYFYRTNNQSTTRTPSYSKISDRLKASRIRWNRLHEYGFYERFKEEHDYRTYQICLKSTLMIYNQKFTPPIGHLTK